MEHRRSTRGNNTSQQCRKAASATSAVQIPRRNDIDLRPKVPRWTLSASDAHPRPGESEGDIPCHLAHGGNHAHHEEPHSDGAPDSATSAAIVKPEVVGQKGILPGRLEDGDEANDANEFEIPLQPKFSTSSRSYRSIWQSFCCFMPTEGDAKAMPLMLHPLRSPWRASLKIPT
jgi:hypothetical protein